MFCLFYTNIYDLYAVVAQVGWESPEIPGTKPIDKLFSVTSLEVQDQLVSVVQLAYLYVTADNIVEGGKSATHCKCKKKTKKKQKVHVKYFF